MIYGLFTLCVILSFIVAYIRYRRFVREVEQRRRDTISGFIWKVGEGKINANNEWLSPNATIEWMDEANDGH